MHHGDATADSSGSPRVQRKRDAKRAHILDTALALLASKGMGGLTIAGLANELDYTPGALYRYFPSKDAIFAALQRRSIDQIRGHLQRGTKRSTAIADAAGLDSSEACLLALVAIAEVYVGMLDEAPEQLRLIGFLLADPRNLVGPNGVADNAPVLFALLSEVGALFASAAKHGALSDGDAFRQTVIYWSSLQGIVQLQKMARLDSRMFDPRSLGAQTAHALLVGWGANADSIARCKTLLSERP